MIERPIPNHPSIDQVNERYELPRLIDTPYPSVSIGDLEDVSALLVPNISPETMEALEARLHEIKKTIAPAETEESSFYYTPSSDLAVRLEEVAAQEAERGDRGVGIVHLDKFIGTNQTGEKFIRLNISRSPDNKLVSRVGTSLTPEEQYELLVEWARQGLLDELLFVDDVVAFGTTFPSLFSKLRQSLPDVNFRILAGIAASGGTWRGIEKIREETGVEVECLTKVIASPKVEGGTTGLAIPVSRDLTLFGGKTSRLEDGTQLAHPYFLPFSKPLPSLITNEKHIEAAMALHDFNDLHIATLEAEAGKELTVADLIASGLGIPTSSLKCLEGKMELPHPTTPLRRYLQYTNAILYENLDAIREECK